MKICIECNQLKPIEDFPKYTAAGRSYYRPRCLECHRVYRNQKAKAVRQNPMYRARRNIREAAWRLGLDANLVEQHFNNHHGKCDICDGLEPRGRLYIDHCHRTGKFRGLLCNNCNTGLGMFRDDPELFRKAMKYLGQ